MPWYLAYDHALYANNFIKKKSDLRQAGEKLTAAMIIFQECGADGWARKYDAALAES